MKHHRAFQLQDKDIKHLSKKEMLAEEKHKTLVNFRCYMVLQDLTSAMFEHQELSALGQARLILP